MIPNYEANLSLLNQRSHLFKPIKICVKVGFRKVILRGGLQNEQKEDEFKRKRIMESGRLMKN